jgi:hypothetical protein
VAFAPHRFRSGPSGDWSCSKSSFPQGAVEGQFNEIVEIHTLGIARRSAGWCRYESEGRRSTLKDRPENGKVAGRCH